jgi:hypothetical protein
LREHIKYLEEKLKTESLRRREAEDSYNLEVSKRREAEEQVFLLLRPRSHKWN